MVYALPTVSVGYMLFLLTVEFLKYSTDVLLLPASSVAILFGLARI